MKLATRGRYPVSRFPQRTDVTSTIQALVDTIAAELDDMSREAASGRRPSRASGASTSR